jgi:WhiB family transcriptional regulator, redox-sensing transcriptional regulator
MALQTGTDQPTTSRLTRTTEVTPMQLTTLDREPQTGAAVADAFASLTAMTGLSALAERVADEQLPCRVNDPELFFADSPADVEYAKTLCTTCPARLECLNGALERAEPWGVWGGEWFVQGAVVPRKRPRGRPRKSEVAA